MGHEIKYSDDSKILVRNFQGQVSFEEVMESWTNIVDNEMLLPPVVGVLNDFTDAYLQMNQENLEQMMSYFKKHNKVFQRLRLAMVTVTPENIVIPILARNNFPQFMIQAFSTVEAAENWIRS
ncbi:hypothetical protein ACFLTU_01005 [Bacteroidota bacterium]